MLHVAFRAACVRWLKAAGAKGSFGGSPTVCLMSTTPAPPPETVVCRGEPFRLYLDERTIQARVLALGEQISADYAALDAPPICVGILNGAYMFMADLLRAVSIPCEVDFYKLSSYGSGKVSSGEVTELKTVNADLADRHVLIVEDIVDTGLSMQYIRDRVESMGAASIRAASLLRKPDAAEVDVAVDYVGFDIDNLFVIGIWPRLWTTWS